MSYRISLENSAGVFDVRVVDTQQQTRAAVLDLASGVERFCDGDVIRIVKICIVEMTGLSHA